MSRDSATIRDQLGRNPDTFPLLNANYTETVTIEEMSTKISTETIGASWVVGSSTNGLVGTNTSTQSGNQQVVGEADRVETLQRVVNPFNRYVEHFRDNEFTDTSNTTATVDTSTDYRVEFTSGQVYQSTAIFKNSENINNVTATWSNTGTVKVEVSADDEDTWETATNNTQITFESVASGSTFPMTFPLTFSGARIGQVLKYRVTETAGTTATFSELKIKYNS